MPVIPLLLKLKKKINRAKVDHPLSDTTKKQIFWHTSFFFSYNYYSLDVTLRWRRGSWPPSSRSLSHTASRCACRSGVKCKPGLSTFYRFRDVLQYSRFCFYFSALVARLDHFLLVIYRQRTEPLKGGVTVCAPPSARCRAHGVRFFALMHHAASRVSREY